MLPTPWIRFTLAVLALAAPLHAQDELQLAAPTDGTRVSGFVSGTWTTLGSPYRVVGNVTVSELVIEEGVRVRVDPELEIRVVGSLVTEGKNHFLPHVPGLPWRGLRFDHASGASRLERALVRGADSSGVEIVESVVTLAGCEIISNFSPVGGGGLRATLSSQDLVLARCTVGGNSAWDHGGGLSVRLGGGELRMTGCFLTDNRAEPEGQGNAFGAGLDVRGSGLVRLEDCTVARNELRADGLQTGPGGGQVSAYGGGVYTLCDTELVRCTFRRNRILAYYQGIDGVAEAWGGALSTGYGDPSITIDNSIFVENVVWCDAGDYPWAWGGAIESRGPLVVVNSTFVRNQAISGYQLNGLASPGYTSRGGAIYHFASPAATIRNSVLWGNAECLGENTVFPPPAPPACTGNSNRVSLHTIVGSRFDVSYTDIEQGQFAGPGNLALDPLFQGAGSSYEDLVFSPASPCIDAGDPDPADDDVAFPPSMGTARNDMGHNGGPLAGGWLR